MVIHTLQVSESSAQIELWRMSEKIFTYKEEAPLDFSCFPVVAPLALRGH